MAQAHGQLRRGQVITTYGPGALVDLPRESAIVAGLETWPSVTQLEEIIEPRLVLKLRALTNMPEPQLFAPPPDSNDPREPKRGIGAFRFPEWFVVQEKTATQDRERSRRLVQRKALDRGEFEGSRSLQHASYVPVPEATSTTWTGAALFIRPVVTTTSRVSSVCDSSGWTNGGRAAT